MHMQAVYRNRRSGKKHTTEEVGMLHIKKISRWVLTACMSTLIGATAFAATPVLQRGYTPGVINANTT